MPVFRVERTHDYTVMSNFHLKDKRLSLKAKGLLSQMLSLPDDWDYTLSGLCFINRESKDAIRSAINELERAGYIRRRQTTDRHDFPRWRTDHLPRPALLFSRCFSSFITSWVRFLYPSATLPLGSWAKILLPSALISFARTEWGISVPNTLILLP